MNPCRRPAGKIPSHKTSTEGGNLASDTRGVGRIGLWPGSGSTGRLLPAVQWLRHALVCRGENKTKQKEGGGSQGPGVGGRGANMNHAECVGVVEGADVG